MTLDIYKRKDPNSYDSVQKAKAEMDKYDTYTKSNSVLEKENLAKQNQTQLQSHANSWNNEVMSKDKLEAYNNWANRPDFSYDVNGDALYQQYKDLYINQGRLAMMDTMGQAAAMTGGYGNSYAASVGNQAYQGYLQKLNEVVPELYNMAYNMYQQEGEDLKYAYDVARDDYNTKYGEWADMLGFLQSEQSRLDTNAYNEANLDRSMWESDRTYKTELYNTALDWATNNENTLYTDSFNKATWKEDYALDERQVAASELAAANADKTKELEAKYADWISPDDVETDDYDNYTRIKGESVRGIKTNKGTVSGFRTDTGDNFNVTVDGVAYEVENKGKVTDDKTKTALDEIKASDGGLVSYDNEIYVKSDGNYYKVGATNGFFGIGETEGFRKLIQALSN